MHRGKCPHPLRDHIQLEKKSAFADTPLPCKVKGMESTSRKGRDVRMRSRLREFAEHVRNAPTNELSERVVRIMIERVAKSCSMAVLVQLGQCLVDCRQSEMQSEAEQN